MEHELMDVHRKWHVFSQTDAVLLKNHLWCSLIEPPFLIGDLIKSVLRLAPLQNHLYAKLISLLSSSTRPVRRHQDDIFAICCNEPCLPVAPLSATIMACNLLVMCEGQTFIHWHLGIFYFLFPVCSTGRLELLQFSSQGQREVLLINVLYTFMDTHIYTV